VEIKGLQQTSLIDYPGVICATVFTPGCNLRCPFCHNRDLVLHPERLAMIPVGEVFALLQKRAHLLEGICVTGGEPTLQPALEDFLHQAKSLGLKTKLDTNGTRPDTVLDLLQKGLLDYVALDVKSPPEKYFYASGGLAEIDAVLATVSILRHSSIDHEFRTTVIPGLRREDLMEIARLLRGARRYVLQSFRPGTLIFPRLNTKAVLRGKNLQEAAEACRPFVQELKLRGV